jgi:hypothetical protein
MSYTKLPQSAQNVFATRPNGVQNQQSVSGVRQDKRAFPSARTASGQPAPDTKDERAAPLSQNQVRSQNHITTQQRAVKVTAWVKPGVKAELERKAAQEGLSVSATTAALLERALQQTIDMQYGALLQPVIQSEIRKNMRGMTSQLAWLLVRVAFATGQTRSLVINILGRQVGMTPDLLKSLLEHSEKSAKGSITRKAPELTELMEAVEQWLRAEAEEQETHV